MPSLRNSAIYFFIFIFLMIAVRYVFIVSVIQANKEQFKQEAIHNGLVRKIFIAKTLLYIDSEEITWKDHNKEVQIQDQIFEVLSITVTSDGYFVNVIEDLKESNCINYLKHLNQTKNAPLKDLVNLLSQLSFFEPVSTFLFQFINVEQLNNYIYQNIFELNDYHFKIIKPPRH